MSNNEDEGGGLRLYSGPLVIYEYQHCQRSVLENILK